MSGECDNDHRQEKELCFLIAKFLKSKFPELASRFIDECEKSKMFPSSIFCNAPNYNQLDQSLYPSIPVNHLINLLKLPPVERFNASSWNSNNISLLRPIYRQTLPNKSDLSLFRPIIRMVGHFFVPYCLAIDKTSQILISGSDDGKVKVWQMPDMNLLQSYTLSKGGITEILVHPSNSYFCFSDDKGVFVTVSIRTGLVKRKIDNLGEGINAFKFSSCGKFVAISTKSAKIYIWKFNELLDNKNCFCCFQVKTTSTWWLEFTPGGSFLVFVGGDLKIYIFSLSKMKGELVYESPADDISSITINKRPPYSLICVESNTDSLTLLKTNLDSTKPHISNNSLTATTINNNNMNLNNGNSVNLNIEFGYRFDDELDSFDVKGYNDEEWSQMANDVSKLLNQKVTLNLTTANLVDARWNCDESLIIVLTRNALYAWQSPTKTNTYTQPDSHEDSQEENSQNDRQDAHIKKAGNFRLMHKIEHKYLLSHCSALELHPTKPLIAFVACVEGTCSIWDITLQKELATIELCQSPTCITWAPDGSYISAADYCCGITVIAASLQTNVKSAQQFLACEFDNNDTESNDEVEDEEFQDEMILDATGNPLMEQPKRMRLMQIRTSVVQQMPSKVAVEFETTLDKKKYLQSKSSSSSSNIIIMM
ncbi:hypothetical protein TRFO_08888 [Tritrichomonas foetus]|uniref:Uncharacterized protein n=1 Tax=Tritrichomonas foetus TaxID=1144522 RepID=A0A1J4JL81_9EUKA|nr:hypothetical protein TRFO_08888 [Tritrichomonas foetus]|eukprot:OHS98323.1 hypothetical protein TRFO_08888 [Tritrichomonas foetus]